MERKRVKTGALACLAVLAMFVAVLRARAQATTDPYPNMAAPEQYLMEDQNAEIALARTAAPDSISRDAEIMVLGRHGYETAVKGKNGFLCVVQRGWGGRIDDPDFWNPKVRSPACFNAPAARSYFPRVIKRAELALAGRSKTQILEAIQDSVVKRELPALEPGAMCYMMSKQQYLTDSDPHWRPHVMFFIPETDPIAWGSGLPGAPLIGFEDTYDRSTTFIVPVGRWSDGTPFTPASQH